MGKIFSAILDMHTNEIISYDIFTSKFESDKGMLEQAFNKFPNTEGLMRIFRIKGGNINIHTGRGGVKNMESFN